MTVNERELKPTFPQSLFRFESPTLIPDHYEDWPNVPNFLGTWALFGWSEGDKTISYAVDAISEEQATLLAEAKKQYFEETLDLYGYSTDVYILSPDGNHQRYYAGRTV
jgi:hypothetical protein